MYINKNVTCKSVVILVQGRNIIHQIKKQLKKTTKKTPTKWHIYCLSAEPGQFLFCFSLLITTTVNNLYTFLMFDTNYVYTYVHVFANFYLERTKCKKN